MIQRRSIASAFLFVVVAALVGAQQTPPAAPPAQKQAAPGQPTPAAAQPAAGQAAAPAPAAQQPAPADPQTAGGQDATPAPAAKPAPAQTGPQSPQTPAAQAASPATQQPAPPTPATPQPAGGGQDAAPAAAAKPAPAQTGPQPPQPPAGQAAPPAPPKPAPRSAPPGAVIGGLNMNNASLIEVVDILARSLKINYILDPRLKGSVTINTYGEIKPVDERQFLETILRINGAAMVQVGDLYRIVPLNEVGRLPIQPLVDARNLPDDERIVLNLIFLKYVTLAEMFKLIQPFLGEGANMT